MVRYEYTRIMYIVNLDELNLLARAGWRVSVHIREFGSDYLLLERPLHAPLKLNPPPRWAPLDCC